MADRRRRTLRAWPAAGARRAVGGRGGLGCVVAVTMARILQLVAVTSANLSARHARPSSIRRRSARRSARLDRHQLDAAVATARLGGCVQSVDSVSVPSCPRCCKPLGELARNLRWCWHTDTQDLFRSVDPQAVGRPPGSDPIRLLADVSVERLQTLSADKKFVKNLRADPGRPGRLPDRRPLVPGLRRRERRPRRRRSATSPRSSASPRCCRSTPAVWASWPVTTSRRPVTSACRSSGSACSTGMGYFRQSLNLAGWQQERYPLLDPELAAADPAARRGRARCGSRCRWPAARCTPRSGWPRSAGCRCCCWTPTWSRTAATSARSTDRLYGGGTDHRLAQEVLLGIGGVRAIRAYCAITGAPAPGGVPHQRGTRRLPRPGADPGVHGRRAELRQALEQNRAGTVFTTHTPVPAGIDRFPRRADRRPVRRLRRPAAGPDPGPRRGGLRGR